MGALAALPVAFVVGLTFVLGHARLLPYRGAALDRAVFMLVVVGLPAAVAALIRALARRRAR